MNKLPKFRSISVLTLFFFIMNCLLPGISRVEGCCATMQFYIPIIWMPHWPNGGTTIGGGNSGSSSGGGGGSGQSGGENGPSNPEDQLNTDCKGAGPCQDALWSTKHPVSYYSGRENFDVTSMVIPGRGMDVVIRHQYQSGTEINNQFGYGWMMNYYARIKPMSDGTVTVIMGEDGNVNTFTLSGTTLLPPDGVFQSLVHNADGTWLLTKAHGTEYNFDVNGNLSSIVDRNGNTISLEYTVGMFPITQGMTTDVISYDYRLLRIVDTLGREIHFTYYTSGRMNTITDFMGRQVKFTYDSATDDLLSVKREGVTQFPSGLTQMFTYDADHNLKTVTDPKGQTYLENHYDNEQRVAQQDIAGQSVFIDYTIPNMQTTVTDRNGFVKKYNFNTYGGLSYTEVFTTGLHAGEPAHYMTYYGFNVHGRPVTVQYSADNGVIYSYDLSYDHPRARGNVLQIRRKPDMTLPPDDATDLITVMTYESNFNQIKTVTDPKGNITTYTYDYEVDPADPRYGTAGNLVTITYPTAGTQTPEINYTYNQYGQVTRVEDPNGNVTEYEYDAATGLVSRIVQDPGGINAQTLFTYDSYLNIDTITDPNLHTTDFTYNEIGWLIDTTNDLGYVTRYDYDQNGNVIHISRQADASGTTWQTWSYTYNALNKVVTVTDPLFRVSTYAYDGEENLNYVQDFENNVTTYDYDERNLLYKVTDANSPAGETYYDYDLNGNLSRIVDAENHETIYEYDEFDRLETTRFPDLSESTLAYDKNSNLIDTVLPDTLHIEYVYDALNRVTNKSYPSHPDRNVAYSYDPGSRLTAVSTASADINFGYDNANRVLSATQTISGLAPKTVQYNYDASGNRSQVIYPSGRTLDYTYDGINRLTDIEQNSVSLAYFDYDLLNRRTLKSFPSTPSLESAYSYYFDNRLEELVNRINGGGVISQNQYTYDNVGNRLSHMSLAQSFTYGYNDIYELTSVSGSEAHSYLYDNVGNRTTADSVNYVANSLNQYTSVAAQAITYDTNGNLTDDGTNTYAYDEENRLLTADNINHSASYTYDPFNRRVSKTVDGVTTYYVYDGDEVIAEYDVGGLLTAEYTYADSIDEVLTMDRNGNTYYYHYDGLGSVTDVTDAAGAVQESYKYDPYGNPSIFDSLGSPITSTAIGNRYMFTGREWDAESLLYYYRARMYDPALGRFLQRDPLGYVDSLNLYSYVLNNPINFFDPYGLDVYWVNNNFADWVPSRYYASHSFIAVTERNARTGREEVTATYSWVATDGGSWEDPQNAQNKLGAQAAIDSLYGATLIGDEYFECIVTAQYENRKNEKGGYFLPKILGGKGHCKTHALTLIEDSLKVIQSQRSYSNGM